MARVKVRIELHEPGIKALLKAPDTGAMVEQVGRDLARYVDVRTRSDAEWTVKRFIGRDRVRVHVATGNPAAMQAEASDRVLTRAAYMLRAGGKR